MHGIWIRFMYLPVFSSESEIEIEIWNLHPLKAIDFLGKCNGRHCTCTPYTLLKFSSIQTASCLCPVFYISLPGRCCCVSTRDVSLSTTSEKCKQCKLLCTWNSHWAGCLSLEIIFGFNHKHYTGHELSAALILPIFGELPYKNRWKFNEVKIQEEQSCGKLPWEFPSHCSYALLTNNGLRRILQAPTPHLTVTPDYSVTAV